MLYDDATESSCSVTVSLIDGVADGNCTGHDALTGLENASGSFGDDTITGDNGPNTLGGGQGGADSIYGLGGDDFLNGRGGGDFGDGGDGFDQCINFTTTVNCEASS